MKSERNIPELLTLLRKNIEEYWGRKRVNLLCDCLCVYINILFLEHIITLPECSKILEYIEKFRPVGKDVNQYWWAKGVIEPRIEFLDKLIEDWKNMSPIERMKALRLFEKDYKHDI